MVPPTQTGDFSGLRAHMIGIGGAGMSGAAAMLLQLGAVVSGSDAVGFDGLGTLVEAGAKVSLGHRAAQLHPKTALVVVSAAIPESNPELAAARQREIPVIKYAQLLGLLMKCRTGVAVAGTHGKSTTTAMCAHLFREGRLDPSFLFGASSRQLSGGSAVGSGPHLIVESCEFDRSFLHLQPNSAAILNVEADHLDCYGSFDEIVGAFEQFASHVEPDGLVVCSADDCWSVRVAKSAAARVETFGLGEVADWRAVNLEHDRGHYSFDVVLRDSHLMSTCLAVPGLYNVGNALAAIALAHHAGIEPDVLAVGLTTFAGIERRMSWRGEGHGVTVVDDYAHHPTAVRLSIEAARCQYKPRRTWVVFQPHQYARTCQFMQAFAESFGEADEVIIPDIYAAREPGAAAAEGAEELVSRICRNGGRATYLSTLTAAADHVAQNMLAGDLVVTMGAGDVWKVADELVARIC